MQREQDLKNADVVRPKDLEDMVDMVMVTEEIIDIPDIQLDFHMFFQFWLILKKPCR